jgi:hypothetical protein
MVTLKPKKNDFQGDGIIIFRDVACSMKGERIIRSAGFEVKLVAPPQELRMGCDLALEVNLVEQTAIERLFKVNEVSFVRFLPLTNNPSQMIDIIKTTDFGKWYMIKSGNMKLSFEKASGLIVNISGGGCPDIPYLSAEMVDKTLRSAPQPRDLGYTLCATMLQRAYEEAMHLYTGDS